MGIFQEQRGVFVSLHIEKRLRGCIGVIEPKEMLGESIVRCAAGAALEDPRFRAMQPAEVDCVEIEVSILTPMHRIEPSEIEIGVHGLLVECGVRRGLLLPQVASEHGLDREQFLEETCIKAGLGRDAWKDPATKLYGFTCEIVKEHKQEGA
jgi:AmmeMemoRadiSam system protein A